MAAAYDEIVRMTMDPAVQRLAQLLDCLSDRVELCCGGDGRHKTEPAAASTTAGPPKAAEATPQASSPEDQPQKAKRSKSHKTDGG